jgi:NADP-dependent 3-hydroxy acid dehydrogenase YdfG
MELAGTGVRVSCVQPGRTRTHLFDHWRPEQLFSPEEGMIPADAVARCVQFVLEQPEDVVIPRILVMPSRQPT